MDFPHNLSCSTKQGKTSVFDLLFETTECGIRDYCENVLPMEFRESQSSYFGKKDIALHCDVFLLKENGAVKKYIFCNCL